MNKIHIFDTTLRDGEQSPGVSLNLQEKLEIAQQLAKLKVDVIEAGFPIASQGDFEGVRAIAQNVKGPAIAALARASKGDIDRAWEAIKYSDRPRIHTFIATSDIHLKYKLQMTRDEVLKKAVEAVAYAATLTDDVEFSAEDAFRSDLDYLCQIVEAVIDAGAVVVNIPDTVGYATPWEFGNFIAEIKKKVPNIDKALLSVHCHNDLGLGVANSLAAIKNGAQQVECTVNGIGERAGNASLEEIVMALYTRKTFFNYETDVDTREIYRTSRLVRNLSGMSVQPNKAVVGKNAFAHESGIHQDGVLKERTTYEIMNPELIGLVQENIVLGKHSGRHAFKVRLQELGHNLDEGDLEKAFVRFKSLADKKREITDKDLDAIVEDEIKKIPEAFKLEYVHISSGTRIMPTATVGVIVDEQLIEEAACGSGGPIDASFRALDKAIGIHPTLENFALNAITGGRDAMGEVNVTLKHHENVFTGRGISTDIMEASVKAYINALNKLAYEIGVEKQNEGEEQENGNDNHRKDLSCTCR
ncbi:2-isopropylmalate synthase [Desulfitispora alkaliphila]|uniref:2-isopropylmalate synthase n=1 Tax=Desulfitispora alkaliphila TaxID=622674 RepID=UPI003D1F51C3